MKIGQVLVQDCLEGEDTSILHAPSFEVNIRLYKSSDRYRELIKNVISYMEWHLNSKFDDYQDPKGVSAPTLGIPFSILGYKDGTINRFCINPRIADHSGDFVISQTNCPCYRPSGHVSWARVKRYGSIDLEFYDLNGHKVLLEKITKENGGYIIQHELNHCLGISPSNKEE